MQQNKGGQNRRRDEMPVRKNEMIRTRNVLLVRDNGNSIVLPNFAAQEEARKSGLDLVEVGFQKIAGEPTSIARIIDYSKWMYQKKQKEKEAKRNARATQTTLKELTFSLTCDDGDRKRKVEHAKQFLENGDKVKLVIQLKGRQINLKGMAKDQMEGMLKELSDVSIVEGKPNYETRDCFCILRPGKRVNGMIISVK